MSLERSGLLWLDSKVAFLPLKDGEGCAGLVQSLFLESSV